MLLISSASIYDLRSNITKYYNIIWKIIKKISKPYKYNK